MTEKEKTETKFSNKFLHVGVVVRDMEKAIERLESLGIGPFKTYDFESLPPLKGPLLFRGKPYEGEVKVYVAKIGNIELELFQPVSAESPFKEFLDEKGYVPPSARGWVKKIKKRGKEATREIRTVDKAEAEQTLTFTEMLLKFVYEFPSRLVED